MNELDQVKIDGANSYAIGMNPNRRNPYCEIDNMPASTGESIEEWAKKVAAWFEGYDMEKAMRL